MNKTWKRIGTGLAATALVLGASGMALHHVLPHPERPGPEEFGLGPRRSAGARYEATIAPERPLEVRTMQSVRLMLTDSAGGPLDGAGITVSGGMPEHGHGLPTRPRVTRPLGGGTYQVDGLKFNMRGWWVLTFGIDAGSGRDSVTFNLDL